MWIRERVLKEGPVSFAQFMEWALYHPTLGYYARDRKKIGREGDFYTAPSVHPVFAEVLADVAARLWEELGRPEEFVLLEWGAGEGKLARDVLGRWQAAHGELFERVKYRVVEVSASLAAVQQEQLRAFAGKVQWMSPEELRAGGPYVGVVLTNELVDAFPVHRVKAVVAGEQGEEFGFYEFEREMEDGDVGQETNGVELRELVVDWDKEKGCFAERVGEVPNGSVMEYCERYWKERAPGQVVEVGVQGIAWYRGALELLERGAALTIDYGFEAEMLHHPSRQEGTLRGFYRHQLVKEPFVHIGEMDLTYDVNLTALREAGEASGWKTEFVGTQAKFLLENGILQKLEDTRGVDPFRDPVMKRNLAIKQLILPGGMGEHFKVLLQTKR
jgi:SAM-dependent MidA family methyltransferase